MNGRLAALAALFAAVFGLSSLMGCKGNSDRAPFFRGANIDIEDPSTCKQCHGVVVEEWEQSMHARAHHERDPIYAGVRAIRLRKEGPELAKACAGCHTPRQVDEDGPVAKRGVTCATCHHLSAVEEGKHGVAALLRPDNALLVGPHDIPHGRSPAHVTGGSPSFMKDGETLCLACHAEMRSATGVPICTTGPEAHALGEGRADTCVSCHMPKVKGIAGNVGTSTEHASHAFLGPHRAWYGGPTESLGRALEVTATLKPGELKADVENLTGHGFPSGFPSRVAGVAAVGLDAGGNEVWKSEPALFRKRYLDAEGKPTLAPYAKELAEDSRLKAGETRQLSWAPPATVVTARVVLVMRLLAPPLAKKLGLTEALEAEPRTVVLTEVKQ